MSYVRKILRPGEQIIVTGKLHWIIYLPAIVLVLLSFVIFGLGFHKTQRLRQLLLYLRLWLQLSAWSLELWLGLSSGLLKLSLPITE